MNIFMKFSFSSIINMGNFDQLWNQLEAFRQIETRYVHYGWIGLKSHILVLSRFESAKSFVSPNPSWKRVRLNPKPSFQCASPISMRSAVFSQFHGFFLLNKSSPDPPKKKICFSICINLNFFC